MLRSMMAGLVMIFAVASNAGAAEIINSYGMSTFGDLKYGPDFKQFDTVNPSAPKGGTLRLGDMGGFADFNMFNAAPNDASGLGYLYDTLMVSSTDEVSSQYCLLCTRVEYATDNSWMVFTLRGDARWHDGKPVTAADVVFTFTTLLSEKAHPQYSQYLGAINTVTDEGNGKVKFTFKPHTNREILLAVGGISILPAHYWKGRDFAATTLDPPLGSGPYRLAAFEPNRYVEYERVDTYWAKDHPTRKGSFNFDRIRIDYYRDEGVMLEAFKGGQFDFRNENVSKNWATAYDIPAVHSGDIVLQEFPHQMVAAVQGFAMNLRRPMFQDWRVRRALVLAYDFDWANANNFYGIYTRTESYFQNSPMWAKDDPTEAEVDVLRNLRNRWPDDVPEQALEKAFTTPKSDRSGQIRPQLLEAQQLLADAGYEVRDFQLVNKATGEPLTFEIVLASPAFERVVLPYIRNLKRLNITATVRTIDSAQYQERMKSFDYDMVVGMWSQSMTPGQEQALYWGSASADIQGSRNLLGIKNHAVDWLIAKLSAAKSRAELTFYTKLLDRVLQWNHYIVPHWHSRGNRIARWNKFGIPDATLPLAGFDLDSWWVDPAKQAKLPRRVGGTRD